MSAWEWGTNPQGTYYAGRLHLVARHGWTTALCGLPVDYVWQQRPTTEGRALCPECCMAAIDAQHPAT